MGMGINNPDIFRVVQYRLPANMCSLMQRAGRAARGSGTSGEFIWLVDFWCFGITGEQFKLLPKSSASRAGAKSSKQGVASATMSELELLPSARPYNGTLAASEAERRSSLPDGFWKLINMDSCIRRGILEYFGQDLQDYTPPVDCCSKCDGLVPLSMNLKPPYAVQDINTGKKLSTEVLTALNKWRASKAPARLAGYAFNDPEILMHDSLAARISRTAGTITSLSNFKELVWKQWPFFEEYGPEVFDILQLTISKFQESSRGAKSRGKRKGRS